METTGGGILGKLGDKLLTLIGLALLILVGISLWRMGPDGRVALWNGIWRTAVWLALAATVPWISRLFITKVLEFGSNWPGVVLIGVVTLVDLIAGRLLMQGWPSGGWGWTLSLAALALAGAYNYLVTEYLAEQTGG